jgi:hypothetical protein
MSRKTIITLAASAIIGLGCLAMVSTDAFARGGRAGAGVGRPGVGVGAPGRWRRTRTGTPWSGGRRRSCCYRSLCKLRIRSLPTVLLGLSQKPGPEGPGMLCVL